VDRRPIDLWVLHLDTYSPEMESYACVLSSDEIHQAERFGFKDQKRRFMVAHAGLRKILAKYILIDPASIQFEFNSFGKPGLAAGNAKENFHFNLSHSNKLALVAVARDRPVGVDVERIKPLTDHLKIAGRYFSPDETEALHKLPASQSQVAFVQLWTGKEALIKARGSGLSLALDQFSLAALIARPHAGPCSVPDPVDGRSWWVSPLKMDAGFSGAVCIEGEGTTIQYMNDEKLFRPTS
jgi:4'-phosphopantetheinyl transferase